MLKRTVSILLTGVLALNLVACGDRKQGSATGNNTEQSEGSKTITVAVLKSDRFLESAIEKYKELHPEVNIEVKKYSTSQNPVLPAGGGAEMERECRSKLLYPDQRTPKILRNTPVPSVPS